MKIYFNISFFISLKGMTSACALLYEVYADVTINADKIFQLHFSAANAFIKNSEDTPFIVHTRNCNNE